MSAQSWSQANPDFRSRCHRRWKAEFDSPIGLQKYTFTFKEDGTNLTGKASSEAGERKRETQISAPITARRLVFDTAALLFQTGSEPNPCRPDWLNGVANNVGQASRLSPAKNPPHLLVTAGQAMNQRLKATIQPGNRS
jgi:hypothetical protein